jgi:hypothetical protein
MKKYAQGGIFREGMPVPQDIDGGSARPKNTTGSKRKPAAKKAMGGKVTGYAKGGSIDGCATKGKTKGAMVKMAMGGKTC